jgi:hypothetical protein
MNRREALSAVSVIFGGAIVGSNIFLSGCKAPSPKEGLFSAEDITFLDTVGETIIPTSPGIPGAKDAKIGEFMKTIVTDCYTPENQKVFTDGIVQLNEESNKQYKKNFIKLTPDEQNKLLNSIDKSAKEYDKQQSEVFNKSMEDYRKTHDLPSEVKTEAKRHYLTMMKQLTIWGYFTSEIGATKAQRYVPVPGKFDGAYPYKKGDKNFGPA